MRNLTLSVLAAATMLLLVVDAGMGAAGDNCDVPQNLTYSDVELEWVRAALKAGKSVKVLVIGTAPAAGLGVRSPAEAYPARLEAELARRWPGQNVTVVNVSWPGATAAAMVDGMAALLAVERPTLVIWQTGTVDALRGIDINDFGDALVNGEKIVGEHEADLVFMNSQFGGRAFTLRDASPYLDFLDQVSRGRGVIMFPRYAMMRYWVDNGMVNFSDNTAAGQSKAATFVHECIARNLAEMLVHAAQ